MNRRNTISLLLVVLATSATSGWFAGRLRADTPAGNPTPVVFTGLIEGAAAVGNHKVSIGFWKSPDSIDPADELCVEAEQTVTVKADKQLAVPVQKCIGVLGTTGLWYQLNVDGTKFPRVAVTAVPSAIFAQRAASLGRTVTLQKLGPDGKVVLDNQGKPIPHTDVLAMSYGVCGQTAPTTGKFEDLQSGTVGLAAARIMCQKACASPTANICDQYLLWNQLESLANGARPYLALGSWMHGGESFETCAPTTFVDGPDCACIKTPSITTCGGSGKYSEYEVLNPTGGDYTSIDDITVCGLNYVPRGTVAEGLDTPKPLEIPDDDWAAWVNWTLGGKGASCKTPRPILCCN